MDFARRQRDPKRHLVGLSVVLLLHALVIYGLLTGLARKAVEVIKKPVSATIVEEIKKPPPPPPPPPKKVEPPPLKPPPIQLPYVPPPDIPPPVEMTPPPVSITAPTPPPQPYTIAPPAPPVVVAPPAPKPAVRRGITRISGDDPSYPREAIRNGVSKGRVVARLQIDEKGNVTSVEIVSSNPPHVFDRAVRDALQDWKFKPEGEKYVGEVEINFTLKDE